MTLLDQQFYISVKSNPTYIDIDKTNQHFLEDFELRDSIFTFYPVCNIYAADFTGLITYGGFFTEGLEFNVKMGSKESGFIDHNFYWHDSEINDTIASKYVNGKFDWLLNSSFRFIDVPKSRSWKAKIADSNTKSPSVVKDIFADYNSLFIRKKPYLFDEKKEKDVKQKSNLFLSTTGNNDYWYQNNILNREFLMRLTQKAYKASQGNDPFFTFINLQNEAHFSTLGDLFARKPISDEIFRVTTDVSPFTDRHRINDYQVLFEGAEANLNNYNRKIYSLDKSGSIVGTTTKITDFITKSGPSDKKLIRKAYLKDIRAYPYFGTVESTDTDNLKGYLNWSQIDSALPYQMKINISHNKDAVAGRTIKVSFDSPLGKKSEFDGKWLIMVSSHHRDSDTKTPGTELIIGKSGISLQSSKLKNDF